MQMSPKQFDQLFDRIDNGFVGSEEHVVAYQRKYVSYFSPNGVVTDIGCGQGAFLRAVKASGRREHGIDMNPVNIATCKEKGLSASQIDAFQYLHWMGRDEGHLRGIFMGHMIEHFDGRKAVQLLQSCYEALAENGVFVLLTPNFSDDHIHKTNFWLSASHVRPYPLEWLKNAFCEIGFEVIAFGYDADGGDTFIVGKKVLFDASNHS